MTITTQAVREMAERLIKLGKFVYLYRDIASMLVALVEERDGLERALNAQIAGHRFTAKEAAQLRAALQGRDGDG